MVRPTYLLAVVMVLGHAGRVAAHALGAECKLVGDRVRVDAYYDDDTPAGEARVTVLDSGKKQVAEGRTDASGRCSFPRPPAGTYLVVVDAGHGHRTQVKMTIPPEADAPPTADVPATISDGPGREEFTRFPWLKVGIGLGAIAAFSLALWLARQRAAPQ